MPTTLPEPEARDMAFVASAIEPDGGAALFYTSADEDLHLAEFTSTR